MHSIFDNGANAVTFVAGSPTPDAYYTGADRQTAGIFWAINALWSRRPIAAVEDAPKVIVRAYIRNGHEDAVTIRSYEQATINSLVSYILPFATFNQLTLLLYRGHTPCAAPFHMSNIILCTSNVIAKTYTTIIFTCFPIIPRASTIKAYILVGMRSIIVFLIMLIISKCC